MVLFPTQFLPLAFAYLLFVTAQAPNPPLNHDFGGNIPWQVEDFMVYKPTAGDTRDGAFVFYTFRDLNQGRQLDLRCFYNYGSKEQPDKMAQYVNCPKKSPISFRLQGDKLSFMRVWKDDRDSGSSNVITAMGNADLTKYLRSRNGALWAYNTFDVNATLTRL